MASFEVSVSFGWMRANSTDASFEAMGLRKSPKGLKAVVVPMNCDEFGSKIGSAWFKIRLNREIETCVPVVVFLIWL